MTDYPHAVTVTGCAFADRNFTIVVDGEIEGEDGGRVTAGVDMGDSITYRFSGGLRELAGGGYVKFQIEYNADGGDQDDGAEDGTDGGEDDGQQDPDGDGGQDDGGTDDGEDGDQPAEGEGYRLEIGSTRSTPAMNYAFAVPGEVSVAAADSIEDHDQITTQDGVTWVKGLVGPKGTDAYRLDERPTEWTALDNGGKFVSTDRFRLTFDGEEVDLDGLLAGGRQRRRLEIVAPGELDYSFAAEGEITPVNDEASDWSAEGNDEVRPLDDGGWRADGYTGNGYGDAYEVTGEITDFTPRRGSFSVYVDGKRTTPLALLGEEDPPTGEENPVGGGAGYQRTVGAEDADVVASDLSGLQDALQSASQGEIVFLAGSADLDMAGTTLTVPEGVTLASNRGLDGAPGGRLRTDQETTQIRVKEGARITGLRIQGKYYSYFNPIGDPNRYPTGTGLKVRGPSVEIDNCEVWGHAYAAIHTTGYTCHVHHNHIHHTPRDGLGYGVVSSGGHPVIERNYFNYNRHAVAGSGGGGYTVRFNHFGPDTIGHVIDMHTPGGDRLKIHQNTVEAVHAVNDGSKKPAVAIRGTPSEGASIERNWFYNPTPPRDRPDGWTNEAIIQVGTSQWENVSWADNHLGSDPPTDPEVGAPRLRDDPP